MCTLVRSPHLLLLGFALLSSYAFFGASSTSSDEQARGNNIGLRADDSPRGLRRKHGVGALAPLARITLGEDQGGREEAALTQGEVDDSCHTRIYDKVGVVRTRQI